MKHQNKFITQIKNDFLFAFNLYTYYLANGYLKLNFVKICLYFFTSNKTVQYFLFMKKLLSISPFVCVFRKKQF